MRKSRLVLATLVFSTGCAATSEAPPATTSSAVMDAASSAPTGPLRLAYVAPAAAKSGPEAIVSFDGRGLHDSSGDTVAWPRVSGSDDGVFGYALRETTLTTESGDPLGRIAADTRVRVTQVKVEGGVERAEVALPAWAPASGSAADGPLRAWMPARSLTARPIGRAEVASSTRFLAPAGTQHRSVPLRDPRWQTLAYTFCGALDLIGTPPATGLTRVEQHDGGITLFGFAEVTDLEPTNRCPRPALVREHPADGSAGEARLVLGEQSQRYDESVLPAGLAPADLHGGKLATVVAKKKTVYWVDGDGAGLRCQAWTFGPTHAGVASLGTERHLENGEELAVSLEATVIPGSATSEEVLAVTGPVAEVIGKGATLRRPQHASPRCSRQYRVVGSDPTSFTLFRGHVDPGGTVMAYSPADAERWYTDRNACEQAITGTTASYAKSGLSPHDLCE